MNSKSYEYMPSEEEYEISNERKDELIRKVKDQIRKGTMADQIIAHHQILNIGENDDELDFLYDWLYDHSIEIIGIDGTISGEIPNYHHMPRMGQSFTPEVLDDEEQKRLFWELNNFSNDDKKNNTPEYKKVRSQLIEHNMRLAKWVVSSYEDIRKLPISLEDKRQMAYLGLIDAVDKFNPSLGYSFSTYACTAIYRRIIREAYRDGEAKQNIVLNEQLAMLSEIENRLLIELGREASPSEIANTLGISLKKVHELERLRKLRKKESLDQIESDKKDIEAVTRTLSDVDRITETDSGYIKDGVYTDEDDTLPVGFRMTDRTEEKAMAEILKETIRKVLSTLPEKERGVLIQRFGLDDGSPKTIEEIGRRYHITIDVARGAVDRAIRKLKHPLSTRELRDWQESL